jgi:hypothetical protein
MKPLRPWIVVTILCLIYIIIILALNRGNPLSLVTIGTQFSEGIPDGSEGYDGQFNYYIIRDPNTAAQYIDVPAYRFQRILLPALGIVLSLGQEALIPWALLVIGLVSLAAGTALMEMLLVEQGVSRWYALVYGLSIGIFGSVRLSLSEPLAYALVLGGIVLAQREKWLLGAVVFALAALAKETTILIPAAYGLYWLYKRQWVQAVVFGVITLLPFIIWQWVLYTRLGTFGTPFEIIPFMGVIRIITESEPEARLALLAIFGLIVGVFVLVPTLWALRRCWRDLRANRLTVYTFLLFTTSAIMLFVPFSTYREPIGILRFIIGLQIAVLLYAAHAHNTRVLRNSTIWIMTSLFAVSLISS